MSQYIVILMSLLIHYMYYESGCIIPAKNRQNFLGEFIHSFTSFLILSVEQPLTHARFQIFAVLSICAC